ncbi:MAG: hypothetical protein CM15mP103_09340 [Gammaproteobacteria bacterium]|nr:MAG: hypothetical protein CM15mP103_09340 [Gammaproteobacteria bacterium]
MTVALAKAGCHVIYCQSRYPNNDSALIMEKVALDMAACVRDAKERLGYSKVVLAGWSGGAALSLFYQSQRNLPLLWRRLRVSHRIWRPPHSFPLTACCCWPPYRALACADAMARPSMWMRPIPTIATPSSISMTRKTPSASVRCGVC